MELAEADSDADSPPISDSWVVVKAGLTVWLPLASVEARAVVIVWEVVRDGRLANEVVALVSVWV
jgi:hypothetical protein